MSVSKQLLHELVAHSHANANLAATAFQIIKNSPKEDQNDLFCQFVLEFKYTPTDGEWVNPEIISRSQEEGLLEKAKKELDSIVILLEKKTRSEVEFNEALWHEISDQTRRPATDCYMLLTACGARRDLPYIDKSNLMTMEQGEFETAVDSLDPTLIAKIRHIMAQQFNQITEDASMFLPIIQAGRNDTEKKLLLTLILINFRRKMTESIPIPRGLASLLEDDDEDDELK